MTHRLPDWQLRMEAFVRERTDAPFVWGTNDCAIFASDCVMAITGQDPAPAGLRKHRTAKQAYRAIARHGGLPAIATAALGQPIAPLMATVGDVLLVRAGKRDSFGICSGATALTPAAAGLAIVPTATATMAWRVA